MQAIDALHFFVHNIHTCFPTLRVPTRRIVAIEGRITGREREPVFGNPLVVQRSCRNA